MDSTVRKAWALVMDCLSLVLLLPLITSGLWVVWKHGYRAR